MQEFEDISVADTGGQELEGTSNTKNIVSSSSTQAAPGAGASDFETMIRRLEARSLAQQRGVMWDGNDANDEEEQADADDDSAGGDEFDGDSDAGSSFIDDSDLKQHAARNGQVSRSSLLHGEWFILAANQDLEHIEKQAPPPAAAPVRSTSGMEKRLVQREKTRKSFIADHRDEARNWRSGLASSAAAALKTLEAAASGRRDCPFTADWDAKEAGLKRLPDWPHDLDDQLSALDEAVCGPEEAPLVGQSKRAHRPAGYTAALLAHAVPFSEPEIKRQLKRLQSVRAVSAAWSTLQQVLGVVNGMVSTEEATKAQHAAVCATVALNNYLQALIKHRSFLRSKERTHYTELYGNLSDSSFQAGKVPVPELLGLALSPSLVQSRAVAASQSAPATLPDGVEYENFTFNPRTTVFWEEKAVQSKALKHELLSLLQPLPLPAGQQLHTQLEKWAADAALVQQAAQLVFPAQQSATMPAAATAPAAAAPAAAAATAASSASAPTAESRPTLEPLRMQPTHADVSSAAKDVQAGASGTVYGHFAQSGAANSVLVVPGPEGQPQYVPSEPALAKAALEGKPMDAASKRRLERTAQEYAHTWANFKQPPPLTVEELQEAVVPPRSARVSPAAHE